ncbi:MAG: hypothetical protein J0H43_02650, partial [Actinobacteria bacterium]|nr:hypothetical protein [Actinomycetota bacterium]
MTSRRIAVAAAGVAVAAGVLGLAGPASATTPTTRSPSAAAAACDKLPWEAAVQGAPTGFHAGSPSGDYLWHDTDGFHLRVTHADHDQRVYSGVI